MKRITVITGENGGIGNSVVNKFLEKDYVIVLDTKDVKNKSLLENDKFSFIRTDVTNVDDINKAKKIITQKFGRVSNLISMAGINMKSEIGGMNEITIEDIDKSIRLNLNAHIYMAKLFMELFDKEEGIKNFIMISSINAISDYGLPAYSAAKAGINGFMKSITTEFGKLKIRTNTISLGTVPHNNEMIEEVDYYESKLCKLPFKKFVKPNDVADVLYSLIYQMNGIVGQNIILDMGQSV